MFSRNQVSQVAFVKYVAKPGASSLCSLGKATNPSFTYVQYSKQEQVQVPYVK